MSALSNHRKHLLIKRCDWFTCFDFDCRKTHTLFTSCAGSCFCYFVFFFHSMCMCRTSVVVLVWVCCCQKRILASTFCGWYSCLLWHTKRLNIVWFAKHYMIWHGQLSRRQYILSLAFVLCLLQFFYSSLKNEKEKKSGQRNWSYGRMEENELGRKRKTLKKHISMRLMNVFAKMNNSKKRGRGNIYDV